MNEFITEFGEKYPLNPRLRDRIVPDWREMLQPIKVDKELKVVPDKVEKSRKYLKELETNLKGENISFAGQNVLEIGCHTGVQCFLMAELGASYVKGIDIDEYFIYQSPDMTIDDIDYVRREMAYKRHLLSEAFPEPVCKKVSFETLDVADLKERSRYDIVISWDTLEHVQQPELALRNIFRAVVPGGISIHTYHPFFCYAGGHSLCTLDFLFAHCVLSEKDFRRYIQTVRPKEEKQALAFYYKNLNRMSIEQLRDYVHNAGFEFLMFITPKHADAPKIDKRDLWEILSLVQRSYPHIKMEDLIYDRVFFIVRKP